SLQEEDRAALGDIVVLVVDESASQRIAQRPEQVAAAVATLEAEVAQLGNTELRILRLGDGKGDAGTLLMTALSQALGEVPRDRLVGAILLSDPHSVRYFSGFSGEDSWLLVGPRWLRLLTDGRFIEQAGLDCPHIPAIVRTGGMMDILEQGLSGRRVRRLGIEGNAMTVTLRGALGHALGKLRIHAFSGEIPALRERKDPAELMAIRKAVRIAEGAMREMLAGGARKFVGRTERQIAAELDYRMRMRGAARAAFETIVAAGSNSALPHYRPGGKKVRKGDFVLIDWGAVVDGYASDLTRVVFTGSIPAPISRIYEIVLRAQAAGIRAIAPGVSCSSVD
ncbi:hypothetical protein LCGC14_3141160, partial [marine sediment metagenome]